MFGNFVDYLAMASAVMILGTLWTVLLFFLVISGHESYSQYKERRAMVASGMSELQVDKLWETKKNHVKFEYEEIN